MDEVRLARAAIIVINENRNNPEALQNLSLCMPKYLESLIKSIEYLENKVEQLEEENNLLLQKFDKQIAFPFSEQPEQLFKFG